jgi:hypothetical protein
VTSKLSCHRGHSFLVTCAIRSSRSGRSSCTVASAIRHAVFQLARHSATLGVSTLRLPILLNGIAPFVGLDRGYALSSAFRPSGDIEKNRRHLTTINLNGAR